jgi:uncharacterized membrane protein
MGTNRLEAFSDGVIAIIITIMVLDLKVPADPSPAALLHLWPIFLSYVLSFLLVAIYWVNHHHMIHLVHRVDAPMLWMNINLLFWLSLTPFVTAYMGEHRATPLSVALYGAVQVLSACSFGLLRQVIARTTAGDPKLTAVHNHARRKVVTAICIYLLSIPAAFVAVPLALLLIATPAALYFLPDRRTAAA